MNSEKLPVAHSAAPWLSKIRSGRFFGILVLFVVSGAIVASGLTSGPDDAVVKFFKAAEGKPSLDITIIAITTLGDATVLVVVGIVLSLIRRTRKEGLVFLIAIVVIAIVVMYIKPVVGRQIPPYPFQPGIKLPEGTIEPDSLAPYAANLSFPSGHAARATAFAFIMGYTLYKKSPRLSYVLWTFPVVIGITRVYVMQNYPTDIAGGILFGLLVSIALSSVLKLEQPFSLSRFKTASDGKTGTVT